MKIFSARGVRGHADAPQPRVTRRCLLEDLEGFDEADVDAPIEDLVDRDEMIRAFYERHSQSPEGQETVTGLTSRIVASTLHSGAHRGATWHQQQAGVVWLLAARFHRSRKPDDAYPYFRGLDAQGRFMPTEDDYRVLVRLRRGTLARALAEEAPRRLDAARASPGEIQRSLLGGRVAVRLAYEPGDPPMVTVAISRRARPGEMPLPPLWEMAVVAAFLPNTPAEELSLADNIAGQPVAADETAYCDFA